MKWWFLRSIFRVRWFEKKNVPKFWGYSLSKEEESRIQKQQQKNGKRTGILRFLSDFEEINISSLFLFD